MSTQLICVNADAPSKLLHYTVTITSIRLFTCLLAFWQIVPY